jgi:hypothetical protein
MICPLGSAATAAAKAEAAVLAAAAAADPNGQIIVRGDLASTFERFDDELYRAWQNTDAYSLEYVDRLKDEVGLLELAEATQSYLETAADAEESKGNRDDPVASGFNEARLNGLRARAARVACRRVLHMYFKSKELNDKVKTLQPTEGSDGKTLAELATLVYRYGDDNAKSQTILAHIYNHALDNRFYVLWLNSVYVHSGWACHGRRTLVYRNCAHPVMAVVAVVRLDSRNFWRRALPNRGVMRKHRTRRRQKYVVKFHITCTSTLILLKQPISRLPCFLRFPRWP